MKEIEIDDKGNVIGEEPKEENIVVDSNIAISIEINYDNIKKLLFEIEATYDKLKNKIIKYKDLYSRATGRKSMYERKIKETMQEQEILATQYCEVILVANEHGYLEDLLKDKDLKKWWAEQIEKVKQALEEQSLKRFEEATSGIQSTSAGWTLLKTIPIESLDSLNPSDESFPVVNVNDIMKNT